MKAAILFELLQILGAAFLIYFSGRKVVRLIARWRHRSVLPRGRSGSGSPE